MDERIEQLRAQATYNWGKAARARSDAEMHEAKARFSRCVEGDCAALAAKYDREADTLLAAMAKEAPRG